jgi:hypothetical protein
MLRQSESWGKGKLGFPAATPRPGSGAVGLTPGPAKRTSALEARPSYCIVHLQPIIVPIVTIYLELICIDH